MKYSRLILDSDLWHEVFVALGRNKKRTISTAMGIFWGMCLLVILLSLTYGFQHGVMNNLSMVPKDGFMLFVSCDRTTKPYAGLEKNRYWNITLEDLEALQQHFSSIDKVIPSFYRGARKVHNSKYSLPNGALINGVTPDYFKGINAILVSGRDMTENDLRSMNKVCWLGYDVVETLFPDSNPIGQSIEIDGLYFQVVGTIRPYSDNFVIGPDVRSSILCPLPLINTLYGAENKIDYCLLQCRNSTDNTKAFIQKLKLFLYQRHQIDPTDEGALHTTDISELSKIFGIIGLSILILCWIVGIGTLIAAIVGVGNIMLVSVNERRREIGIRRAVGATKKDIAVQIILESLTITTLAGIVGISLGCLIMGVVCYLTDQQPGLIISTPMIPFSIALLCLLVVVISGFLASSLPIYKALNIKVVHALQEE